MNRRAAVQAARAELVKLAGTPGMAKLAGRAPDATKAVTYGDQVFVPADEDTAFRAYLESRVAHMDDHAAAAVLADLDEETRIQMKGGDW